MSLKAKLVSTIAAFCMVICLLSVGIWAAGTGTVNIGGTVNFEAGDVNVKIELVSVTGAGAAGEAYTKTAIEWDATDAGTLSESWTDMNFEFQKPASGTTFAPIVIKIKVTNMSQERGVSVAFTADKTEATTNDSSVSVVASGATSIAKATTAEGLAEEYTITISTTKNSNQTVDSTAWTGSLVINNVKANAGV